jgi:hypothetical protein
VCVDPGFWPRDVRFLLEQEFSTGFAPDGSPAFFNPDRWSFGQPLRRSEVVGRAQRVAGVHHVAGVEVWRMDGSPLTADEVPVGPSQIVRVDNDPDHRERGTLRVLTTGGRG